MIDHGCRWSAGDGVRAEFLAEVARWVLLNAITPGNDEAEP